MTNIDALPIPFEGYETATMKEWLAKIDEELNELKTEVILFSGDTPSKVAACEIKKLITERPGSGALISEEAADTISAIVSMLEAIGINAGMRTEAQRRVNEKNRERGRYEKVEC